jgi:S-adenosylmethionine:tRNA ribosyltransferase-isomerase
VYERDSGNVTHDQFYNLPNYLKEGDVLVMNQTKVIPARLHGRKKKTGGKVEILLLNKLQDNIWDVIVGGKGLINGVEIDLAQGIEAVVHEVKPGSKRTIKFDREIEPFLSAIGELPLPPYIHKKLRDPAEYQTVFAKITGSAAAPTAGLHFTDDLLEKLRGGKIGIEYVTLHVGLDTFAPVKKDNPLEHHIHTEWCSVSPETANRLNIAKQSGGRIIAVGTTSVRTLESAALRSGKEALLTGFEGQTDLFILPGYDFQFVDAMITNFHLPESTLLMLVSAFVGREKILSLYESAKELSYRFYSFGDAMLFL